VAIAIAIVGEEVVVARGVVRAAARAVAVVDIPAAADAIEGSAQGQSFERARL
jgi:hypothetical protein